MAEPQTVQTDADVGDLASGVEQHAELLGRLGPHTTGKGCLYVKRLADVDTTVLARLVAAAHQALDGTILRT